MAGPIALVSILSRLVTIQCPFCKNKKTVDRRKTVKHHRVCPKCHRQFPDPLKAKRR